MHDERRKREIKVVKGVLDVNDRMAEQNRKEFSELGLFVLNVMSSPGSGKTTLLTKTIEELKDKIRIGVVVGDICTTRDADRLSLKNSVPVVQICTDAFGGDCHLAAHVVKEAASGLDLSGLDLLIVENVGNLVCPAEFDIGTDVNAMVLSVTEGDDKPKKYPLMFTVSEVLLLNKMDLIEYTDFDMKRFRKDVAEVNPHIRIFPMSAKTGEGLEVWCDWLANRKESKRDE